MLEDLPEYEAPPVTEVALGIQFDSLDILDTDIGSPEECVNEIKKYQELGIQELILRCQWPGMPNQDSNRAVELFGQEVLPRFG